MQIMQKIKNIFEKAGLNLWIRAYDIIVISANSGILGLIKASNNLIYKSLYQIRTQLMGLKNLNNIKTVTACMIFTKKLLVLNLKKLKKTL